MNNNMEQENQKKDSPYSISIAIVMAAIILSSAWIYTSRREALKSISAEKNTVQQTQAQISAIEETVTPSNGVVLPVSWGNLGIQLVNSGVIDAEKFKALYEKRGRFTDEYNKLLTEKSDGKLKITKENAGYILNLFWALGLANKNAILDSGEMANKAYGGAGNFASTGGWTMAVGNPMNHYSRHSLIVLTAEQQALVDKVSRGIYRPCCSNSTHFPDCNHGMAMLGFLELMASQEVSEKDMYGAALTLNSYWFPSTYMTILEYMKINGIAWTDASPQEILGANYSSSSGFARVTSQVARPVQKSGGGCGVLNEQPAVQKDVGQEKQGGCGV
ncbi:MAG: hypothetical protein A3H52_02180 [Candidatus Zambryskibacteria bacterium RIFCSPLOWO2_02_FULL_39_26]|nr:MAG: hypothetical protein A3H52_02180 [Candidatus Zambryskibacteria bacterium RIFCSPLOWO2_02_FULL_39_26]